MEVEHNISLAQYTTIKLGGVAENLFFPEDESEIMELKRKYGSQLYLIGGGSNLLINDKKKYSYVAVLRKLNAHIEILGNGCFKVGAGIRLQKLINTINECGYGGIEYLYSVPGLVGGAIVMNAGRSKKYGNCISDYIVSVRVIKNGEIIELQKEECGFCFRGSIFKNREDYIVLSATFEFPSQKIEQSEELKRQRIELCKSVQSDKGVRLVENSNLTLLDVDINKAIESNQQLMHPHDKPVLREKFFEIISDGKSIDYAVKKCLPKLYYKQKIKRFIKFWGANPINYCISIKK